MLNFKNKFVAAVISSCLLAQQPAQASIDSDMESYFDSMGAAANISGPSSFEGQSAGYYTLGNVWTRFPERNVSPVNFQMPKVRAGCGGIDIFAGSFSFINSAELVAMLKATANNAVGFAFKLAIDSISPQIGGVIDKMQSIAQQANDFNLGSCEAAAGIVGSLWPKIDRKEDAICQSIGMNAGQFADAVKARRGCGNNGQRTDTLNGNDDPVMAQHLVGPKNYTWDALEKSSLHNGFSADLREMVMTMVGTIIIEKRPKDDDPLPIRYFGAAEGSILNALIDGSSANGEARKLTCTSTTGCLDVKYEDLNLSPDKAMRPKINNILNSISLKIKSNTKLDDEERNLLNIASMPLYKVLTVHAASGFQLTGGEMNTLSELVAIDIVMSVANNLLDQLQSAQIGNLTQGDQDNLAMWQKQLSDVRSRINHRETSVTAKVNRTFEIVDNAQRIETTLQNRMSSGLAASLNFSRGLTAQGILSN